MKYQIMLKENMKCKHNLHYWNLSPYLSFGPSAHSHDLTRRWWNVKSLDQYINSLKNGILPLQESEELSKKDNFNELVLNGLRLSNGLNISNLNKFPDFLNKEKLDKINTKWDCISISNQNIKLVENGFLFVDEITKELFV